MNENMVVHLSDEAHRKLEESIKEVLKHGLPMTQLINSGNVEDNSQNRTAGTERAKEREELSLKKRRTPCSSNHQRFRTKIVRFIFLRRFLRSTGNISIIFKHYDYGRFYLYNSVRVRNIEHHIVLQGMENDKRRSCAKGKIRTRKQGKRKV